MTDTNNLVIVSDLHCGCKLALCPTVTPPLIDSEGGTYHASPLQLILLDCWNTFWDTWIPAITRDEPYMVVINGDAIENEHHGSKTPISTNMNDQRAIAEALLRPVVEHSKCQGLYVLIGSPAHDSISGQEVESLADKLGAIPTPDGRHARYDLRKRVGNALVDISHHIGCSSRTQYETSAPQAEWTNVIVGAATAGEPIPDFIVRSHRHRYIATMNAGPQVECGPIVTPGWQLKTPWVRQTGHATMPPHIGGTVIRQGSHHFYARTRWWRLKQSEIE